MSCFWRHKMKWEKAVPEEWYKQHILGGMAVGDKRYYTRYYQLGTCATCGKQQRREM